MPTWHHADLCRLCSFVVLVCALAPNLYPGERSGTPGGELQREVTLSGTVRDSVTGKPIEEAVVFVEGLKLGTSSDKNGAYRLGHVPTGKQTIICRCLGYGVVRVVLTFTEEDAVRDFLLPPNDITLPGVVVSGERQGELPSAGNSVVTLSTADVTKLRGQTLAATLESVPGITTLQTGPSISKPVIRGLHSERVVVLNAGVPQEGQQWGGEHAPEIDPFAPSRIEVVKGAAGVEYGAGAIGGVIKIEPRKLRDAPGYSGLVTLNGFSNNRQGAGSLLLEGAPEWLPGVAVQAQGSVRKAGNSSAPTYVMGNTSFSELDGAITVGYKTEGSSLEAYYSLFSTELGIYRGSHIGSISDLERAIAAGGPLAHYDFSYDIIPPKQNISHELFSLRGEHQFPSLGRLEVQFGRQSNHRQEYDAYRFFNNIQQLPTRAAFDLTLTTYTIDVKLVHNPVGNVVGAFGVSGERQGNVGVGSTFLIPNFRAYSGAVFARESWNQGALTVDAGARFDYRWMRVYAFDPKNIAQIDLQYDNVSAALGATYDFSSGWSLGAGLETAYRPPGINELYSNGVHHGTAEYERGDPALVPERSYSLETTLTHLGETTRGEISLYANSIRNFIYLFPEPAPVLTLRGAFPAFSYNQTNALLYGVDGYFDWHITHWFTLDGTVSITRGDNRVTGEPLYQMPADRVRITGSIFIPSTDMFHSTYIDITGTLVARQNRFQPGIDYVDPPPGYSLLDAGVGSEVVLGGETVRVNLSVKNVFNTSYRDYLSRFRYYIDEPGRDFVLRVQVPLGRFED
jgi:iron complex outermembrane receptor protein